MTRKTFFKTIFCGVASSVSALASKIGAGYGYTSRLTPVPEGHPLRTQYWSAIEYTYKGYGLFWTGWKESQNTLTICGQWIAASLRGAIDPQQAKVFCASAPGARERFSRRLMGESAPEAGVAYTNIFSTKEEMEREMDQALGVLLEILDSNPV